MKYLVIVDMQNDFLTGPLGNEHCRNAIPGVLKLIKEDHWNAIFLTQDTHFKNYDKTLEGQKLPVKHCLYGSDGWKVESSIKEVIYDMDKVYFGYIDKPTFGSFDLLKEIDKQIANDLNDFDHLKNRFATGENLEFHVCGVCTSICVLANVVLLRAKYPDAKIVVHVDACGDVTPEMHNAAIVCFKSQQCEVVGA